MNKNMTKVKIGLWLGAITVAVLAASLLILPGCTNTLKGDVTANQIPIVEFVNIPPENQRFSRNPEVYWIGTDNDGQITYYRYYVIPTDSVTGSPMDYINALNDTMWTYVDIDPTAADPKTANIIPLKANLNNPVNDYVPQYIFLQAFDNSGAGSVIKTRVLNRNDNPPETSIQYFDPRKPFVTAIFPGGIVTGLGLTWSGSDKKDYDELGLTAPPFQFEWHLYGPFTFDQLNYIRDGKDTLWEPSLLNIVFVTEDARVFNMGDTLFRCDTTLVDTGGGSYVEESCDTTVFSDTTANTPFYVRDTILKVDDTLFTNRFVESSSNGIDSWVMDTGDTLYNVYKNYPSDTTLTLYYLFWIRSRDDADVADLTPEFRQMIVINPRYEREIAVVDFTTKTSQRVYNSPINFDTAKAFWYNAINTWLQQAPGGAGKVFDTTTAFPGKLTSADYIVYKDYAPTSRLPLQSLLKHKVIILYNESGKLSSSLVSSSGDVVSEVFTAIDAGVNAWATWRVPHIQLGEPGVYPAPFVFTHYFGVNGFGWSNWFTVAQGIDSNITKEFARVEDFTGAYSINQSDWPDVEVDTSLLHRRLLWTLPHVQWVDSIAALPEVDWVERAFGTEVMYLYKSKYGADHPWGNLFNNEGSPCGHRFNTSLFRTVYLSFTPLVMKQPETQELVENILTWLYDPNLGQKASVVKVNRYPDAAVKISIDEAKANYRERQIEEAIQEGKTPPPQ